MPATPYFVAAQLVLIAVSAAVVKQDFNKQRPVPKAQPAPMALTSPVDSDLLSRALALPEDEIERFALIENTDGKPVTSMGNQTDRPMGFSGLEAQSAPPLAFEPPTPRESLPSVTEASAPPEFDPVPTSSGYHITSDAATNFDMKSNTVVFSGSVTLKCTDFILTADRLVAHMTSGNVQTLSKLVANGKVDFHLTGVPKEESYRGSGEQAVFNPDTGMIVMSGWPKIIGHGREHNAASATTIMSLNTKSPKLETEGRAQTRLLIDGKSGMPNLTMGNPSTSPAPGQN